MTIIKKSIIAFLVLLTFLVATLGVNVGTMVRAEGEETLKFDESNVLDDLEDSTINGEPFNLDKYNFDRTKQTQVLSFIEYSYSFYEDKQANYGLYVYVYNPKGLKFMENSVLNKIQFSITSEKDVGYKKYNLTYLNKSDKAGFEGLFYKFKVELSEEERAEILLSLNSTSRVYNVSGIELYVMGNDNADEYTVARSYSYSGYGAGLGFDNNGESTLKVTTSEVETLQLDVRPTSYRPEGSNGKNEYTQDSLHSVYFAIPKDKVEKYGRMTKVHAEWLDAVLAPALVTGNQEAYGAINAKLGVDIGINNTSDLDYMYLGAVDKTVIPGSGVTSMHVYKCGYAYNRVSAWSAGMLGSVDITKYGHDITTLYNLIYSGSEENSADNFELTAGAMIEHLKTLTARFGGELVNDKYSRVLFSEVDSEFTEVEISAKETFDLRNETISKSFWDKLFGRDGEVTSSNFNGIKAIYDVKDSDFSGSEEEICKRLYIDQKDYAEFKAYYDENKSDSVVYLFRYQVSDYVAQEATLMAPTSFLGIEAWDEVDTNAYFFTETVNLDFDVIDVTLEANGVETVLACVSSPIDNIPGSTPPIETTPDFIRENWTWLLLAGVVVVACIGVIIVVKLCGGDK